MQVKIGVTTGWEPGTVVEGWPLVYVNKGVIESLEKAGAVPILIPILENQNMIDTYMDIIDGIIVAGEVLSIKRNVMNDCSNNVLYNSNPLRYKNEEKVIEAAIRKGIPLLGICRGYQVLNVQQGGTMIDDDINIGNYVKHQQGGIAPPNKPIHDISIKNGTKLRSLIGVEKISVNSFHRQAVDKIPDGYIVSAASSDGNIEAIESADERFIVGVQFHPEMLEGEVWTKFFENFVNIIKQNKTK